MRNLPLFLAAGLGCFLVFAIPLGAPLLFPGQNAEKVAQCRSLLKTHFDSGKWPDKGTPDYISFYDCYVLICGRKPGE